MFLEGGGSKDQTKEGKYKDWRKKRIRTKRRNKEM